MKNVLLATIIVILLFAMGCSIDNEFPNSDDNETPSNGYERYLSHSDYLLLLDALEDYSTVNRSVIDDELENLNVRQNYEYSFYDGSSYNCFTLNWNAWSSYTFGWIYYVDVDVWVNKGGSLERSMCSYYTGT